MGKAIASVTDLATPASIQAVITDGREEWIAASAITRWCSLKQWAVDTMAELRAAERS